VTVTQTAIGTTPHLDSARRDSAFNVGHFNHIELDYTVPLMYRDSTLMRGLTVTKRFGDS
jgi:hypothetical protein